MSHHHTPSVLRPLSTSSASRKRQDTEDSLLPPGEQEDDFCQAVKRNKSNNNTQQEDSTISSPLSTLSVMDSTTPSYYHLETGLALNCKENVPPPFGMKTRRHTHSSNSKAPPTNNSNSTRGATTTTTGFIVPTPTAVINTANIGPPLLLAPLASQDKTGSCTGGPCGGRKTYYSTTAHRQFGQPIVTPSMLATSHGGQLFLYTDITQQQQKPDPSPLPPLSWVDSRSLWQQMRLKDTSQVAPETELRLRHPFIMPSMRTILLDWMLEVCEEYRIHRETYYLSLSIFDRFMNTQVNILKEQLQLIGVTCLFIASKIEEIYPPKLADFAYVTDGACNTEEIIYMELLICKALNWRLHHCVVSVNTWINIYMQLLSSYFRPAGVKTREFEFPAFSPYEFIRVMQVLDLCTLDITSKQFCDSILAASALYLVSEKCQSHLNLITGFQLTDIHICVQWLQPFVTVINRNAGPVQKAFKGVIIQDAHNIQTHEVSINMLEEAIDLAKYQEQLLPAATDHTLMDCSALMTPPRQERRCLAPLNGTAV